MSTAAEASLLGRIAIHYKLVSPEKLQEAVQRQAAMADPKKRLGEVLLEMKLITPEQLTWLLNAQAQMSKRTGAAAPPQQPAAATPAPAPQAVAAKPQAPPAPQPQRSAPASAGRVPNLEQILAKAAE